jgi:hypothetical protein
VRAKLPLWRTLAAATPGDPRLAEFDFVHLIARAEEQIGQIEELHTRAVAEMLAEETATR